MKIAIITGASSGIGEEFAKQINEKYPWLDEVWLIARNRSRLQAVAEQMTMKTRIIAADMSQPVNIKDFKLILANAKPQIKLLVQAAGYGRLGRMEEDDMQEQLGMIRTNCEALTAFAYLCLPYCKRGTRIINLASSAAFMPQPRMAVYAASKAYVLSFSRALAQEVKDRQITVTAVCPGPVETNFFERAGGTDRLGAIKRLGYEEKEQVVARALYDAVKGKEISVSSILMQGLRGVSKVAPHGLLLNALNLFGEA
ncbi:MAG: SDR family NAD(P)-dependent oxidoreductase [Eubacteriales bacterium]|nr:SDR family NAD(P)-dependent oxidoreductase [Eubacteriales bacterium]